MEKVIFVDFDGTITKVDTCEAMVKAFAKEGWAEINKLWEEKKLSTKECATQTFQLFHATLDDVAELMEKIEIDDYFVDFLSQCRKKNYQVYILSDGYDVVIESILKRYNIQVPYYANSLLYDGQFRIECPHHNQDCGICGTCKSSLMQQLCNSDQQTIYIGDGYSDTCPARKADIVFAKGSLYKYCTKNGIQAIYYNNFRDILDSGVL